MELRIRDSGFWLQDSILALWFEFLVLVLRFRGFHSGSTLWFWFREAQFRILALARNSEFRSSGFPNKRIQVTALVRDSGFLVSDFWLCAQLLNSGFWLRVLAQEFTAHQQAFRFRLQFWLWLRSGSGVHQLLVLVQALVLVSQLWISGSVVLAPGSGSGSGSALDSGFLVQGILAPGILAPALVLGISLLRVRGSGGVQAQVRRVELRFWLRLWSSSEISTSGSGSQLRFRL